MGRGRGIGIGTVYRATWIAQLPETADQDDGPNYKTAEWDCRHKGNCHCRETAEWHARHQSQFGPQPGYYEMRVLKIRKVRLQRAGREFIDERDLVLMQEHSTGDQQALAI